MGKGRSRGAITRGDHAPAPADAASARARRRRGRPSATMRDLILAMRMGEANRRDASHAFAGWRDETNPALKATRF